ncbi:hypothetical protein AGABI1DRAFT_108085 [Agaricus bisporus var. burnettii JB137-S8]|uniref:Uncharacterized protein n=1 Tax=Agaricus bisporus var. burnettii (strain JB137-S8 / ATCC MYA-4627 / FGSC 10392) TaxID=597362 RepID=K5VT33_AGABU|nr:hypothetical protein AGABI2DRAFT_227662 [Agaricus bisporus var. bisporus H97]XP_007331847.1 uncharacterized protein AGABI1DRAFT_108085 [Agaricus bisporus var. burnettii JB137-S8]EKM77589.1 hypothetical protein AGABI1DRAFT_108085 [Agaricus bisporus var. burnettii JB137-S8]EKV43003.1 hypothetical protein AGABI2DRAFT_227662 [Agaricus bisporus var. bisporus H97]
MATLPVPSVLPTPKPDLRATRAPSKDLYGIRMFLWRQRMWFESTFVLSMLEPWEKVLLLSILIFSSLLIVTALFKYLPHHLNVMHHRAVYYIWGQDGGGSVYFWQWVRLAKDAGDGVRGLFMDL